MANEGESSNIALIENEDDTTTDDLDGSNSGALYCYKRDLFYFLELCGVGNCWNHRLERLCGSDEEDEAKTQWRNRVLMRAVEGEVRPSNKTTRERENPREHPQPKRAKHEHSEEPILLRPQNVNARQNDAAGIHENHNGGVRYGPTAIPQEQRDKHF